MEGLLTPEQAARIRKALGIRRKRRIDGATMERLQEVIKLRFQREKPAGDSAPLPK
jgi:hypothetical protein